MYHIRSCYCQSELKSIERYAADSLRVLENKIVREDDIALIRNYLERLRARLEMEHPRCGRVEVIVKESEMLGRLDICLGRLCYYGRKCEFLTVEDIAE